MAGRVGAPVATADRASRPRWPGTGRTGSSSGSASHQHESSAKRYQANLEGYGCTEAFGITNLMEIPERLSDILISLA